MDINSFPLTGYLLILFGLVALTLIIRGLKMPSDFHEREKNRALIRKKLILKNSEEQTDLEP